MSDQQSQIETERSRKTDEACNKLYAEISKHFDYTGTHIDFGVGGYYDSETNKLMFAIRVWNSICMHPVLSVTLESDIDGNYFIIVTGGIFGVFEAAIYSEIMGVAAKIADFMNNYEEEEHE